MEVGAVQVALDHLCSCVWDRNRLPKAYFGAAGVARAVGALRVSLGHFP